MDQARLSPFTPTSDAKPKAYSYLRFSTPDQMRGDSHRRQTELARQYAVRHGLDLDDNLTFKDLGVSAFRGRNAKAGALRAFLDAVEHEYVAEGSYLLVESLDRLSRDEILSAQGLFMQIVSAGINLVTLQDGRCYSKATINANPTDLIISIVTMMRAHEESATKQRRLKAVWQHKRDRAPDRPMTEKAPTWLRLDRAAGVFEVIPERAEVVRRIYSMAEAGVGYERIARTLNREGVATFGRSRAWQRSYIVKLLSSEAVIGTFTPHVTEYRDGHKTRKPQAPIADYFPAIIDRETFERMKAQRTAAKAPAVRGSGELRNLLANLANCPHCGSAMTRVTKGSSAKAGKPYLVCVKAKTGAGCTYRAVTLADVEQAILDDVGFLAGTAPTGEHDLDHQLQRLEGTLDVIRDQIANVVEALSHGASAALTERLRVLEDEAETTEAERVALLERVEAAYKPFIEQRLGELETTLRTDPLDRQAANAAMRRLFDRVIVDYPRGKLVFAWKNGAVTEVTFAFPKV